MSIKQGVEASQEEAESAAAAAKRAVIYLRVSSAQQADKDFDVEGYSIPGQREACARKAGQLSAAIPDDGEFIERGESGTTTKRPALRAMLERIKRGDIDYVIVHKVDRLARNRADDIEIVMAIRQAGAQLVSVTENIDETPAGLLLHGIMSSIAEFYSQNLATEVKKGATQKAKAGGTPFRAPLGYLNTRAMIDGREVRTISVDPERAPLIRDAFALYATGDYSLPELAAIFEERGLRRRPTRRAATKALNAKDWQALLRSPYYIGIVSYAGKTYKGRHEPLVDEATFQKVQDLLTSKRVSGERPWRHFHYLRGSIYCGECGRRLTFSKATGNGGTYDYFICTGRQKRECSQCSSRVAAVEAAVEEHYGEQELSDEERQRIRSGVKAHIDALATVAAEQVAEAERQLAQLTKQEKKLLAAHYADQVSEELFAEEQSRIRRERAGATKQIESLSYDHERVLAALDRALELTDDIQRAYCLSGPQERRLFNQGIFKRLEIVSEEVTEAERAEPFAQLARLSQGWDRGTRTERMTEVKAKTPSPISRAGGLNVESLVGADGIEPPTFRV